MTAAWEIPYQLTLIARESVKSTPEPSPDVLGTKVAPALWSRMHGLHRSVNGVCATRGPQGKWIDGSGFVQRSDIQDHRNGRVQSRKRLVAAQIFWVDVESAVGGLSMYTEDVLMDEEQSPVVQDEYYY